jgi:hypothetical protein
LCIAAITCGGWFSSSPNHFVTCVRNGLNVDLRFLGFGDELRVLQRLGEGCTQDGYALRRRSRPYGEGAPDRLRNTPVGHQRAAGIVGRERFIRGQLVPARHRRAGAHQRAHGTAVDRKLDRGGKRRIGIGLLAFDRQQDVTVGGMATNRGGGKLLSSSGMSWALGRPGGTGDEFLSGVPFSWNVFNVKSADIKHHPVRA